MLDPFTEVSTLVMVCDVIDPVTKQRYDRDPRYIAQEGGNVSEHPPGWRIPPISAPKRNFSFLITSASISASSTGFTSSTPKKGRWNSGREENNLGYRPRYKEGYFPVPPTDHYQDLRSEMVMTMQMRAGRGVPSPRSRHRRPDGD